MSYRRFIAILSVIVWLMFSIFVARNWESQFGSVKLKLLAAQYIIVLPALWWYLRTPVRHSSARQVNIGKRTLEPPLILLFGIYLAVTVPAAWFLREGTYSADETTYRFQSRLLLSGRLAAMPPPVVDPSTFQQDYFFTNVILTHDKWFGKYPPGWPALLAGGVALHADWLWNPLLGLLVLWLTAALARRLFDVEVASLAVLLMVASPFFLLNCIGFMSHVACAGLLGGAAVLFFEGLKSRGPGPLILMFLLLACAFFVRPFTAVCEGGVLSLATLWILRRDLRRLAIVAAAAALLALTTAVGWFSYTAAQTGDYRRSTYSLYRNVESPVEINLGLKSIVRNVKTLTSRSAVNITLAAFPFIFLLTAYAVARDYARLETRILALLIAALVIGYVVQTEDSDSLPGERYYFECYFAAAILAARGIQLFTKKWQVPEVALRTAIVAVMGVILFLFALFGRQFLSRRIPYQRVHDAIAGLRLRNSIVFLKNDPTFQIFKSNRFNPNAADWQNAPVFYMPDPGFGRRQQFASALKRQRWVVATYDPATDSVHLETTGGAAIFHNE